MVRLVAEDVMTRRVLCVFADLDVRSLAKLFLEKRISGAPVTAEDGTLIGVVSQTDLLRDAASREEELVVEPAFYETARLEGRHLPKGFQIADTNTGTVADIMTPVIHSVREDTPVEDVARLMRRKRVHRVVVERGRKPVGLISALDLLTALYAAPRPRKSATRKK